MTRRTVVLVVIAATVQACGSQLASPDFEGNDTGLDDALAGSPTPPSGPGAPAILEETQRQLTAVRESHVSHSTHIDESTGTYDYDCSGFVDYVFGRVAPDAYATLQSATQHRPVAASYESFFAKLDGAGAGRWRSVARARDLVPGDVVAWIEPADVRSSNTGHVMIVHEPVRVYSSTSEVVVEVVDSTRTSHGTLDTRSAGKTTGLGAGAVRLLIDSNGAPVQYKWSDATTSTAHTTSIAMAHLD